MVDRRQRVQRVGHLRELRPFHFLKQHDVRLELADVIEYLIDHRVISPNVAGDDANRLFRRGPDRRCWWWTVVVAVGIKQGEESAAEKEEEGEEKERFGLGHQVSLRELDAGGLERRFDLLMCSSRGFRRWR